MAGGGGNAALVGAGDGAPEAVAVDAGANVGVDVTAMFAAGATIGVAGRTPTAFAVAGGDGMAADVGAAAGDGFRAGVGAGANAGGGAASAVRTPAASPM
ncbi:MAG TPA: hypothetical protein VFQ80_05130 [Thermomicrobiales bacterium]|nr:hypothetical protein [Thermomicrobiales bacterium]